MPPHLELENEAARWFEKEAALYFSSGWSANQALLATLPKKGDLVLMDRFDHASIIDAVKSCEADFRTYRRDNPERLEKYLADSRYRNRCIVTESVFSMDGDCADLAVLAELKNRYNAVLIADEAHALGCFGASGAGLAQEHGLLGEIDIIVAPLGKAAASSGACIAAPRTVIDYMINRARPFIYTTAPPPACAAAALKAILIIQEEPQRRKKLHENAKFLRDELTKMGLNIGRSTTQIIPLIVGDSQKAIQLAEHLDKKGFFILPIRPPTVPPGAARLRISVQSGHTHAQLESLLDALRDFSGLLAAGSG